MYLYLFTTFLKYYFSFFCCFRRGKYCIKSFLTFLFGFCLFCLHHSCYLLRFWFDCAMLLFLSLLRSKKMLLFLSLLWSKFCNMLSFLMFRVFCFDFIEGFFLGSSALIFWKCSLGWLCLRREFPSLLFVYIADL